MAQPGLAGGGIGLQATSRGSLHELHLMIFQGFPAPEHASKISVYINTKCLLPYPPKLTQTRHVTCIQEKFPAPWQPQSPRIHHILTSLSGDNTMHVPFTHSSCVFSIPSELQRIADLFICHSYQTGSSQRPTGTARLPQQ